MHKLRFLLSAMLLAVCVAVSARTYLVAVGIADYSGYPQRVNNLSRTTADARSVAKLYTDNTQVDYALLLDKQASRERILSAMNKVFRKAGKNDIVVFFFSGHGYPGGFCAANGDLLYSDVRKAMARSSCPNKMMFIDACFSGAIRANGNRSGSRSSVASARKAGVMLFLSSRTDETSIERRDMKNGFFTTYLLSGLKGKADTNRDRTITARELFNYVSTGVRSLSSESQHPVMWGNFSDSMPVMRW